MENPVTAMVRILLLPYKQASIALKLRSKETQKQAEKYAKEHCAKLERQFLHD